MLNLGPVPSKTAVDTKGEALSVPWTQWFQTLYQLVKSLTGALGGQYINNAYGTFYSQVNQNVVAINTPTLVALEAVATVNGMYRTIAGRIYVNQPAVYLYQYSIQFNNTGNSIQQPTCWLRKNGTDIPASASKFGVVGTHAGSDGYTVGVSMFMLSLAAGDYVELWWAADSTAVGMEAYPAATVPFAVPTIPSVVVTLSWASS